MTQQAKLTYAVKYQRDCEFSDLLVVQRTDSVEHPIASFDGFYHDRDKAETAANAVAEALNVHHETGLTPKELVGILRDVSECMRPCSTPIGSEGSIARLHWERQRDVFNSVAEIVAKAEDQEQ